jgi:FixJ family two-component response regulator
MPVGSVLIADDEETFRESTSRLLQREGFDCRCVGDADETVESLRHVRYDVLIADIRMPHNPDLRVVREARELDSRISIILVTGYPSAETAIRSIGMGVDAYLTKPLDFQELLAHVHGAVEKSHARRRTSSVIERLCSVVADLEAEDFRSLSHSDKADGSFLATIRTLASCLSDLLVLWHKPAAEHGLSNLCELLDCPQFPAHRQAILHAIEVLEKTKDSFKSKQLAERRAKRKPGVGGPSVADLPRFATAHQPSADHAAPYPITGSSQNHAKLFGTAPRIRFPAPFPLAANRVIVNVIAVRSKVGPDPFQVLSF